MKKEIAPPNYTQIPNIILDDVIKDMGEAELKVFLAIARKTFGWHKKKDKLSLTQLQELTGLSRQGVINGIEDGIKRGTIKKIPSGQSFFYQLLVNEVDQLEDVHTCQLVNEVDTQKKVIKETIKKRNDGGNIFSVYESNIGVLTPMIKDELIEIESEYPEEWFPAAVKIAVEANVRKLRYVHGILKRWSVDGFMNGSKQEQNLPKSIEINWNNGEK